jgi:hypothetical protein
VLKATELRGSKIAREERWQYDLAAKRNPRNQNREKKNTVGPRFFPKGNIAQIIP